jgi:aspartate carbamoyltransferase
VVAISIEDNVFFQRSIKTARDFSTDEKKYLFQLIRRLKRDYQDVLRSKKTDLALDKYKINDLLYGVYQWIGENSTRTKESFWNAGDFHNVKYRSFNESMSSTAKGETFEDTINTFIGNDARCFIIRSKLEGLCRWLELTGSEFAERNGFYKPCFINAGDGKHEHPTQEFLDDFSFWEDNNYDSSHIHIALIGDLLNGRTVHSKVDGLKMFDSVKVDLVAPEKLAMPRYLIDRMEDNGFEVHQISSLDDYILSNNFADKWYFTRMQIERMDDDNEILLKDLHKKISYSEELHDNYRYMLEHIKFYHPLPDDSHYPCFPKFIKNTPMNRFENQFINGRYSRIVILGIIAGVLGNDFTGQPLEIPEYSDDFIKIINNPPENKKQIDRGIKPIHNGIFIDHVMKGYAPKDIWNYLNRIRERMGFENIGGMGVYTSQKDGTAKGVLAAENHRQLTESQLKVLGSIAPGCTINYIEDSRVRRKTRTENPPRIYGISGTACMNKNCISAAKNEADARFIFVQKDKYACEYCDTPHHVREIWS